MGASIRLRIRASGDLRCAIFPKFTTLSARLIMTVRVALASTVAAQGATRALKRRFRREHDRKCRRSSGIDAKGAPAMVVVARREGGRLPLCTSCFELADRDARARAHFAELNNRMPVDTLHFSTFDAAIVVAVAQPGHSRRHAYSTQSLEGLRVAA